MTHRQRVPFHCGITELIVQRYVIREVYHTLLGVTLLLLLIFLSGTLVRILSDAADGQYPVGAIFTLFGLKSVSNLMLVLPLSFFLAVLLALGRLYKDSEMAAMAACGIGPRTLFLSVAKLALSMGILVAIIALYLAPQSEEQGHRILDRAEAASEIEGISAGRFNRSGSDHLIYVESISEDRQHLSNVFAQTRVGNQLYLVSAKGAHQWIDPASGQRYLVLEDGYRYEGRPGDADFRIVHFAEHGLLLAEREVVPSQRRRNAIPSLTLMKSSSPGDIAEFQWRVSTAISVVLLGLLAVPLAKASPRQGRYGRVFYGIMVYVIYNNLLTAARSSVAKGATDPSVGMWWVHLLVLALIAALMWNQSRLRGPRRKALAP